MAKNPNVIATNRTEDGKRYFMHVMNNKATGRVVRRVGYFHAGHHMPAMPKMKELRGGVDELRVRDEESGEMLTLTVPPEGYIFTLGGKRMTFMRVTDTDAPLAITHDAPEVTEAAAEVEAEEVEAVREEVTEPPAETVAEVLAQAITRREARKGKKAE